MWTFNGVRIYTQAVDQNGDQIISELNPIGGGSIYHNFGYEDEKVGIAGVVVGETDKDSLLALYKTGLSYTLSGDLGVMGDFFVKNIKTKRRLIDRQTIRSDLPTVGTPVYDFSFELLEDV